MTRPSYFIFAVFSFKLALCIQLPYRPKYFKGHSDYDTDVVYEKDQFQARFGGNLKYWAGVFLLSTLFKPIIRAFSHLGMMVFQLQCLQGSW